MLPTRAITTAAAITLAGLAVFAWTHHRRATSPPPISAFQPFSISAFPPLSPAVAALLADSPISLVDRKAILSTVGNRLPPADRAALLDVIDHSPLTGLQPGEWHSLANDIIQAVRTQQPATLELTDRLLALWHDTSLDPTLRDYALQHLREWVADQDTRTAHEARPDFLARIRDAFLAAATPGQATCDMASTSTGTALLALDEWSRPAAPAGVHIDPAKIDHLLLAHAAATTSHRGVRATALQLCARRHLAPAIPIARDLAANPAADTITRLAAISLLGGMGTDADHALLADLARASHPDPVIQGALAAALSPR